MCSQGKEGGYRFLSVSKSWTNQCNFEHLLKRINHYATIILYYIKIILNMMHKASFFKYSEGVDMVSVISLWLCLSFNRISTKSIQSINDAIFLQKLIEKSNTIWNWPTLQSTPSSLQSHLNFDISNSITKVLIASYFLTLWTGQFC